ncbi:hypothetical protein U0C82_02700 [Fulvimarina sp. 2208YS6-2-32]|uniref:Uncharacterized protein n=1 Tax=Fulvimarina uroteuthidis TaxID=3098149 RepID=A0ABU5HY42_9HYPH|nr:hypothetical protein [Fulvimarina sp. 2208YS6-2-32]MDY8108058.1 hypothetical protein [Fulvimarina sp. 2208YS6-2-32]
MTRLQTLASALALSAATLTAGGAYADCATELSALKSSMGSSSETSSGSGAMSAGTDSASMSSGGGSASTDGASASSDVAPSADAAVPAAETPAGMDQAAVNSDEPTFTAAGANEGQNDREESTGALSGIAPTPALEDTAAGNEAPESGAAASASSSASSGATGSESGGAATGGSDAMSADATPGDTDQDAVTTDQPTFTETGDVEGQSDRAESTGALSGVAPTPALTDEASGEADDAAGGEASSGSTASNGSTMEGGQDMASTHLAAAQAALDAGNEEACMAAVEQAKQATM